jgi:predicted Zn finger-like uncharacterized protein
MVVQCFSCLTEFELDPHKVPAAGVRARCSVCSSVIEVPAPPAVAAGVAFESAGAQLSGASHGELATGQAVATAAQDIPASELSAQPSWSAPAAASDASSHQESDGTPGTQRRSINPFLTRDPALRAKRLARALVSDIVAYHPARHAEGLRDGTLKTLFRDEIKKSYEEYVDQVGRDFAGSTTHFQDALNDVLASGKRLF